MMFNGYAIDIYGEEEGYNIEGGIFDNYEDAKAFAKERIEALTNEENVFVKGVDISKVVNNKYELIETITV